jgi:hypothetical protein
VEVFTAMLNRIIRLGVLAALVAALAWAVACSDDDEHVHAPEVPGTVNFNLDNVVDGDPVVLDGTTIRYVNPSGTGYSIATLRYVISDVTLHTTSGQVYGMNGIHYRDQALEETRGFSIDGVPRGTYDMVSFTFGLDETKNIRNRYATVDPVFDGAMAWPSGLGADLGYHYMQFEGNFELTGGGTAGFTTHSGARQCASPCGPDNGVDAFPHHHYFRVEMPIAPTTINGNAFDVTIEVNVNGWFTDPIDFDWNDLTNQMIMPNLTAQATLMTNGPSCFSATIAASQ